MSRHILLMDRLILLQIPACIDTCTYRSTHPDFKTQHVSTHASHRSTHPKSHTLMCRHILSLRRLILSLILTMHRRKPSMHRLILSLTASLHRLIQFEVDASCDFLHNFLRFLLYFHYWNLITVLQTSS